MSKKAFVYSIIMIVFVAAAVLGAVVANDMSKSKTSEVSVETKEEKEDVISNMTVEEAAAYQKSEIWGRNNETFIVSEPNIYLIEENDGMRFYSNVNDVDVCVSKSNDTISLTVKGTTEELAYMSSDGIVKVNDFFSIEYNMEDRTFINESGEVRARLEEVEDVDTGRKTIAVYDNDNRIIVYYEAGIVNGNDAFTVAYNDVCTDVAYMLVFASELWK